MPRSFVLVASSGLALVATLLAGCGAPGPGPGSLAEDSTRQARGIDGTELATFIGSACEGASFVAHVPHEAVGPEMPPGYEADLIGGSVLPGRGLNNPHLLAASCANVTIDNVTQADVRMAYSGTLLATGGFYRWEIFVDEPTPHLLPVLQELGWPAVAAAISVDKASLLIEADGVRYQVASAAPTQRPSSFPDDNDLVHHVAADGSHRLLDEELWTAADLHTFRAGALEADGGTWGRIAARLTGPAAGTINPIHSDWSMEFYGEDSPMSPAGG
ncbi:MAG: hypothetical protein ACYC2H_11565 [Thermoplasmatota archaeon]